MSAPHALGLATCSASLLLSGDSHLSLGANCVAVLVESVARKCSCMQTTPTHSAGKTTAGSPAVDATQDSNFLRLTPSCGTAAESEHRQHQKSMKPPETHQQDGGLPLSTSDLFGKSFSIRRDVLNLTITQWKIADSLNLTSITPRDWIQSIGARGGFLTALLTDEEREFVRIVYLPNA